MALAGPQREAEQPDHQDRERYPPQDVDREPEAAEYERQQQDEQDDAHAVLLSVRAASQDPGLTT
jgi:hypothetical protein